MEYPGIADFLFAAEWALDEPIERLLHVTDVGLAESALHAPQAGFADQDLYPTLATKAAVLCSRIMRNHPLPDGNKRTAFVLMLEFIARNGGQWIEPVGGAEEIDETIRALAGRELSEDDFAEWVARRVIEPGDETFARVRSGDEPPTPLKGGDEMPRGRSRGSARSGGKYRSAKTGRYVTKQYGRRHPATTVKEAK